VEKVDGASDETRQSVLATVRSMRGQVQRCYEQRLMERPRLAGRVVLFLRILNGRTAEAQVAESDLDDDDLSRCLEGKARRWRFEAHVKDEQVYLPFSLSPS
jgi:hypothetical protein